jgi:hypothetical protein
MTKQIVVEGPDGSGKSTLVAHLLDNYHQLQLVKIFDSGGPKSPEHFYQAYADVLSREYPVGIVPLFDRFYFSELVYGHELRGKILLSPSQVEEIAAPIRDHGLVIYCRPSSYVIHMSARVADQMPGVLDHLDNIIHAYDVLMSGDEMGNRFIKYDWTEKGALKNLELLVDSYLYGWIWTGDHK